MMIYVIEGGPGILCFNIFAQPIKFYFKVDLIHYKCALQMLEQPTKKKLKRKHNYLLKEERKWNYKILKTIEDRIREAF